MAVAVGGARDRLRVGRLLHAGRELLGRAGGAALALRAGFALRALRALRTTGALGPRGPAGPLPAVLDASVPGANFSEVSVPFLIFEP